MFFLLRIVIAEIVVQYQPNQRRARLSPINNAPMENITDAIT
jgi:hypothetical protein